MKQVCWSDGVYYYDGQLSVSTVRMAAKASNMLKFYEEGIATDIAIVTTCGTLQAHKLVMVSVGLSSPHKSTPIWYEIDEEL